MRNMSFSMTADQVIAGTKTVTRRFGWWFIKEGDLVRPIYKGMGLKKGEKVKPIRGPIRIVRAKAELLCDITKADVIREGFPGQTRQWFISMLCAHHRTYPSAVVNRIEFEYTDIHRGE